MVQHSESYLRRINNVQGKVKPMEEHVAHFKRRLKERFGIEITTKEYYDYVGQIKDSYLIYKSNSSTGLYQMEIKGVTVWVLYGKSDERIPARLKTALIPFKGIVVPDVLNEHFNHTMFYEKVKSFVTYVRSISHQLDLNNKKEFFTRQDIDAHIKTAVNTIKKMENDSKLDLVLISIAAKYFIINKERLHELPV